MTKWTGMVVIPTGIAIAVVVAFVLLFRLTLWLLGWSPK
jgi:hypothetical protein